MPNMGVPTDFGSLWSVQKYIVPVLISELSNYAFSYMCKGKTEREKGGEKGREGKGEGERGDGRRRKSRERGKRGREKVKEGKGEGERGEGRRGKG